VRARIIALLDARAVYISNHARIRMFERNITTIDALLAIREGEIIEEYQDDDPCPSFFILNFLHKTPIHIVLAVCEDHLRIVTVYIPDESVWIEYRTRRLPL